MTALIATLIAALMPALSAGPQARRSADEQLRALQTRYEAIRDFSAAFTHTYEGGVLRRRVTERGTVLVKRPGRMKWAYEAPERKLFVADGVHLYSYIPDDRQVIVSRLPRGDEAASPMLFLSGRGDLTRDFTAREVATPNQPAGTVALALEPVRRQPDYDSLVLVVDADSFRLRALVAEDAKGGRSTFTFSDVRENLGLQDREFTFKIPRGVEVITDGRTRP